MAAEGIEVRHRRGCAEDPCTCRPSFRASVWSPRERRLVRKTFATSQEAKAWRVDSVSAQNRGQWSAGSRVPLRKAATDWLAGARSGAIRNRSGDPYKPSAIRGYEQALRLRILDDLGGMKVGEVTRADMQALVDRMMADGHKPSTIRNTLLPLRVIYRRALVRGEVAVNPTLGLELPAVRGRRDRIASPKEAGSLLTALKEDDALWATALYAGLRLGELQALDWSSVDLKAGLIQVRASWDPKEGHIEPKSAAGRRAVPIPAVLRERLKHHRAVSGGEGFAFARRDGRPFSPSTVHTRALRAWDGAKLAPIGLHECRHTFASFMIAAGVNAKALSAYMGHASVTITFDRYGHLMPGNEREAAKLLDAFLKREQRKKL